MYPYRIELELIFISFYHSLFSHIKRIILSGIKMKEKEKINKYNIKCSKVIISPPILRFNHTNQHNDTH